MSTPAPDPRISLVTSSYNHARFIARTIESVLAQRYPNLEHIVVDGMSTDGTAGVLARFPHLTVIREPDQGQADAINKGFRVATGQILGFLNSDDTLEPGALRSVADAIDPGSGRHIIMGRCRFIDENDRFLGVEHPSAFESHRRVLEIWKGHCLPQPSTFWTREVWDRCGPLHVDEPLMLDYDLFCRFSRQYAFHRIDRMLASYRIHTQSKTRAVTDEQRLAAAIVVSRRYWGSPLGFEYWRIVASYAAFRFNRRVRGAQLMRAGRAAWAAGHRLRGAGCLAAGALVAPDVVTDVVVIPVLKPALSKMLRRPVTRRRTVLPHTEAWFGHATLHDDGWAGPTLVMDLDLEGPHEALVLSGRTDLGRLRGPLELELTVDGRSLGSQRILSRNEFSIEWPVIGLPAGRHRFRITASQFMVPHDYFGNGDFRPLSYRVSRVEIDGVDAGEAVAPGHGH
jgi:glycosyltransferase involved in cell wall biosynthesis